MDLGGYRLVAQRGAGPDGVAFRAETAGGDRFVEVRLLTVARANADRWPALVRRLKRAALLNHPGAIRIQKLSLDTEPPFVALELAEERLLGQQVDVPVPAAEAIALAYDLASILCAAHRLGLSHGRLSPATV